MPSVRTFAQLRAGVLRRGHFENDPNAEEAVDDCINDAVREMWGYKFEWNPDLFLIRDDIAATAGTQAYALPDDFGTLRRVDRVEGTDRFMLTEAPPLLSLDFSATGNFSPPGVAYRLIGGGIDGSTRMLYFVPDPGTYTYEIWYTQAPQRLASDGDELETTFGEDRYVMASAAALLCERQDRPSDAHRAEQARALECLKSLVRRVDSGRSKQITDLRSMANYGQRFPRP